MRGWNGVVVVMGREREVWGFEREVSRRSVLDVSSVKVERGVSVLTTGRKMDSDGGYSIRTAWAINEYRAGCSHVGSI